MSIKSSALLSSALTLAMSASAVCAQADPSPAGGAETAAASSADPVAAEGGLEEIIVTAQRRAENLQRTAVAIDAVGQSELLNAGVTKPTELTALIPSLQVVGSIGPYSNFYVRGVGNPNLNVFSESAVAFNVDGVFIGRPSSTTGFFYDLDRIEVLKGPQGTLYGRNATGGAINVISRRPVLDTVEGYATAEYGNYDAVRLDGAINVPLGEKAALRAAGIFVRHDGYMTDGTDDQKDFGGRISLRVDATPDLKIVVVGDYFSQGGNGIGSTPIALGIGNRDGMFSARGQAFYAGQPNTLLGRTFAAPSFEPYLDNEYWGASATIDWEVPFGTFTFVPAYREAHLDYLSSSVGNYAYSRENDTQTSLEVRFASPDDKPLRALVGGFYFDEANEVPNATFNQQSNKSIQTADLGTESVAIFGRLTWELDPSFRLGAGARYTTERKSFSGLFTSGRRICVRPTQLFPTYLPGCPNAVPFAYDNSPLPPQNPIPTPQGTIDLLTVIDVTGANAKRERFKRPTFRLSADWDITDQNFLFASVETGFRSGGFFFSNDEATFRPEKITAYTLGSKNRFLDRNLQVNVEAFYWRYRDQQVSHASIDSQLVTVFATENVGKATFKGIEAEITALPWRNTLLNVGVQYLDANYNDFVYLVPNFNNGAANGTGCPTVGTPGIFYTVDCSGRRPPNAPEWVLNLSGTQTIELPNDGKLVGTASAHYQSRTLTGFQFQPIEFQDSYWLANTSLTYSAPDDRYFVAAFVNNIFDKAAISHSFPPLFSLFTVAGVRPPRTYGIRAGVKF